MLKVRSSKIPNIGDVYFISQSSNPPNRLGYFSLGANPLGMWHKLYGSLHYSWAWEHSRIY